MLDKCVDYGGNIAGLVGIVVCAVAGIARLLGYYYLLKFEVVTLIIGGTALMVMGCFLKLLQLSRR
jgi:type IV secretory pathway VirB2 component (pilin)